jgi:hypothetical protein
VAIARARQSDLGRARLLIGAGVTSVLLGIGLAASGEPDIGAIITIASLVTLIYALHRFGRSGPDATLEFGDDS